MGPLPSASMNKASAIVRSAAQAVRPRATQAVRQMGSSEEHAAAGAAMWKQISFGGIALCFAVGAYEYKVHMDHHASGVHFEHEKNAYAHRKIRNKAFPWACPDCGLFDSNCLAACKAGQ